MVTHIVFIIIFTIIYYYYFLSDMDYHYILHSNVSKKDYQDNKIINSLLLSVNLETNTGYLDFYVRSSIAKLTAVVQLIISIIINLGVIYFYII